MLVEIAQHVRRNRPQRRRAPVKQPRTDELPLVDVPDVGRPVETAPPSTMTTTPAPTRPSTSPARPRTPPLQRRIPINLRPHPSVEFGPRRGQQLRPTGKHRNRLQAELLPRKQLQRPRPLRHAGQPVAKATFAPDLPSRWCPIRDCAPGGVGGGSVDAIAQRLASSATAADATRRTRARTDANRQRQRVADPRGAGAPRD